MMKIAANILKSAALAAALCIPGLAQETSQSDPNADEAKAQHDARMQWWREAKFGLFIHWGVYAVPAGTYEGKKIGGIGEWIMANGKIPIARYREYAKEFNPVDYDPEFWAALAKEAGMRYMVITSKHHDGFALFPSEVTDWDIADATPYGKDLIGPLADAARKEGLKFGLYYSQAQDWTHPGGAVYRKGHGWDEAHKGDMDHYIDTIAVPQVKEILTRYQPDVLWWDTPSDMNAERAKKLMDCLDLRPGIITNNRLGGGFKGDTETPEQRIPATGFKDRDWEVCMTMNDTWGFKSYDDNWKPTKDLIRKLSDIVSKGGNFLLNIGPTKEGRIPQASIDRLKEIGAWMKTNGEAIYGTTASPFGKFSWGRCTAKVRPDGATLYLHVFHWPADGRLQVPGLMNDPASAILLADGSALTTARHRGDDWEGITIDIPATAPDPHVSVIKVQVAGDLVAVKSLARQDGAGRVTLLPGLAHLHNRSYNSDDHVRVDTSGKLAHLGHWTHPRSSVSWELMIDQPGKFRVAAEVACPEASKLQYGFKDRKDKPAATIKATGSPEEYQVIELGELEIPEAGEFELELFPVKDGWKPIRLRQLTLSPLK